MDQLCDNDDDTKVESTTVSSHMEKLQEISQ